MNPPRLVLIVGRPRWQRGDLGEVLHAHPTRTYRVMVADSVEEALAFAAEMSLDAILLGLEAEEEHALGWTFLQYISGVKLRAPVIGLVQAHSPEVARRAFEEGAHECLPLSGRYRSPTLHAYCRNTSSYIRGMERPGTRYCIIYTCKYI